jgi:hypothetical protein
LYIAKGHEEQSKLEKFDLHFYKYDTNYSSGIDHTKRLLPILPLGERLLDLLPVLKHSAEASLFAAIVLGDRQIMHISG